MKKTKSVIYEKESVVVNEHGETLTTELTTVKKVNKETFLQVYLDDFMSLMRIKEGSEYKIVLWIGKNMNFDTNEIALIKAIKERMSIDIGTNIRTINNSVSALVSKKILIQKGRGLFILNPKLFFKGSLDSRNNLLKVIRKIEYEFTDSNEEIQDNNEG
jgi:hypothetical protein